jgi:transposase
MASQKKYPEEFKKDAVRLFLARGNRTVQEVADGLGVTYHQLYRWVKKYETELPAPGPTLRGDEEVEALRRRVRQLETENTILKKAAFFAKEIL